MRITFSDPIGPFRASNIYADGTYRVGIIRNTAGSYVLTDRTGFNFSSTINDRIVAAGGVPFTAAPVTNAKVFDTLCAARSFASDYFSTIDIDAWTASGRVR